MHVERASFNGNPNLGLYCLATDTYCLVGKEVPSRVRSLIKDVLKVPVHPITLAGTSLIGVFAAANSKGLIVPGITFEHERRALDALGLNYAVIETKLTALGNNVLASDHAALVSRGFLDEERKAVSDALGVPVKQATIAELDIIGSLAVHNGKGCLVHREIGAAEMKFVERNIRVPCTPGTVNMGNPFVSSGILANDYGFIIGEMSGGPEVQNADEAFGFIEV